MPRNNSGKTSGKLILHAAKISTISTILPYPSKKYHKTFTQTQKRRWCAFLLIRCSTCPVTNTELKLEYGAANLDELSAYDANFTEFVSAVNIYAQELLADGQKNAAKGLLELAVSYHADAISIYTTLADLYKQDGQATQIQNLIASAEEINTLARSIIVEKLRTYLP